MRAPTARSTQSRKFLIQIIACSSSIIVQMTDRLSSYRLSFPRTPFCTTNPILVLAGVAIPGFGPRTQRALITSCCSTTIWKSKPTSWSRRSLSAEEDLQVGLVTGKILFGDRNTIWQAGGKIDGFRIQGTPRGWNEQDRGQFDSECETHWASGAMLLIPRRTIETVGVLPEEYFFGVEEWDYSTAVENAGLRIRYVPTFKGYHHAGGSYKAGHPILIVYNGVRNKLVYAQKYLSTPAWLLWKTVFRCYLRFVWPKKAWWGCENETDYRARLQAARMGFADHHGIARIELSDLERAGRRIGPTPTWGNGWGPADSKIP